MVRRGVDKEGEGQLRVVSPNLELLELRGCEVQANFLPAHPSSFKYRFHLEGIPPPSS